MTTRLEAPWYSYQKKVKTLFERDSDIEVGEVYQDEKMASDYVFAINISNHKKYEAMQRIFPQSAVFGNVTMVIELHETGVFEDISDVAALYETVFSGNPIVKDIREVVDGTGTKHAYVRFQPEVLQFFDDDTSDYNGNWSGLAQDIAREVFADEYRCIHFCTADIRENNQE